MIERRRPRDECAVARDEHAEAEQIAGCAVGCENFLLEPGRVGIARERRLDRIAQCGRHGRRRRRRILVRIFGRRGSEHRDWQRERDERTQRMQYGFHDIPLSFRFWFSNRVEYLGRWRTRQ
jgi:hypothetical protein